MISLDEYNRKYNTIYNSDTSKKIEEMIDDNIKKDILSDVINIRSTYSISQVSEIMRLLNLKYQAYGWIGLNFYAHLISFTMTDNACLYEIKYELLASSELLTSEGCK